jgi:hypothetical protein
LTQGFVADRLCSDGYTALAAAPWAKIAAVATVWDYEISSNM